MTWQKDRPLLLLNPPYLVICIDSKQLGRWSPGKIEEGFGIVEDNLDCGEGVLPAFGLEVGLKQPVILG